MDANICQKQKGEDKPLPARPEVGAKTKHIFLNLSCRSRRARWESELAWAKTADPISWRIFPFARLLTSSAMLASATLDRASAMFSLYVSKLSMAN